ncbi:MAG: ATP-dependent Lon protease, partial [Ilumatobacteraceae bacterium]
MTDLETRQLTLPVLAVPAVVLPGTVFTLTLSSDASRLAVQAASAGDGRLVLHNSDAGDIGVVARVPNSGSMPNGEMAAIVQAEVRARIVAHHAGERGSDHADLVLLTDGRPTPRVESVTRELRIVLEEIAKLRGSRRLPEILRSVADPGQLADAVTTWSEADPIHQAAVLGAVDVGERVDLVIAWAKDHLAELQVSAQIRADVTEGVDKQQREYLLRQQLAAIRKELGEGDDDVVGEYRTKV